MKFWKEILKSILKLGLIRISRQNILRINEGNPCWKMHRGRGQVQQHDQDSGREPGLVGYAM